MYAGNFYNPMDPMMWPFSTTPQSVGSPPPRLPWTFVRDPA